MTMTESKSTFELEPNPFERSFATKESSTSLDKMSDGAEASKVTSSSSTNKHNLHIPNISNLNSNGKLPALTPPIFTPGGRRLPPLLSPGAVNATSYSNPGTPGSALWNNFLANNNISQQQQQQQQQQQGQPQVGGTQNGYNSFLSSARKTGLTPNESNIRTGLTPGGLSHFPFGSQLAVPGLSTPGALLNGPITPGLSSLLGLTPGISGSHLSSMLPPVNGNSGTSSQPPPQILQPQPVIHEEPYSVAPPPVVPQMPTSSSAPPLAPVNVPQQKEQPSADADDTPPRQTVEIKQENRKRNGNNLLDSPPSKKKSTRGRRPGTGKKQAKEEPDAKHSDSSSPNDSRNKSDDEKRKNFLERNRVAASKCRQRKKQLVQKMEEELAFYSNGYRELSAQVTQLHDQLINLRGIIAGHKDCTLLAQSVGGFEAINQIVQQADLAIQMSAGGQTNMTSMPSTIPTNLHAQPQVVVQVAKDPIVRGSTTATPELYTNTTTPMVNDGNSNTSIASHHSLTDLRSTAAAQTMLLTSNGGMNNGDLRAINSMSNLAAMNQRQFV